MSMRFAVVTAATMIFTLLPAAAASAQPPGNDDFSAATTAGVPFTDTVDVTAATTEPGEPVETCAPVARTVWYDLTVDAATEVLVDSAGSDYDTVIAVWTGPALGDLTSVACVDDTFAGLQSAVTFSAEPGVTYHIQVGAFGESPGGTLQLSIDEAPRQTGRPQISKSTSRGVAATAFDEDFDEENGASSFSQISVSETRQKFFRQRPFRSATLFVSSFEESFDPDTGERTFTDISGFAELTNDQFDVDRRLRSGFVDVEVVLSGFTCTEQPPEPNGDGFVFDTDCTSIGPEAAQADVVWTGQGAVGRSRFTDRFSTEGFRSSFRGSSTSRQATVAGGVQGETIVIDFDGADGTLARESSAEMVVVRGRTMFF